MSNTKYSWDIPGSHERKAKQFLKRELVMIRGCWGPEDDREFDKFFRHLKLAIQADNRERQ